ncbi:hypothetical protein EK21DRAFT_52927 [Setomelanomma holmii]|uniref:Uncharacterized protein n=1 Tax=Setomelanomma holmii TaxID=210430 RepID=A0A9P4LU30_9PLEO|nr:hypothetical protein EK21DRAFT_52927 [Setomelanomma holmii]
MESRHSSLSRRDESPRPSTYRQRSNSFPIVEALGCSTPEAQLLLAEGRAAVRKRRERGRRNRSVDDEDTTTFNPKNHLRYLEGPAGPAWANAELALSDARSCHARIPSNTTDRSTSTIVPQTREGNSRTDANHASPLGNYSANLALFIKAQLKSIPTYQSKHDSTSPLSPRSCPDFSFPVRTPPLSPNLSLRRPADAPKIIDIPPVRPPARSAFSAWSSTDDDTDEDLPLPDIERYTSEAISRVSSNAPSLIGYYEMSNNSSFLFSSTPLEEDEEPETAKAASFPDQSALPGSTSEPPADDDYPSSDLSRPQLTSSSAPSYSSSSASASSYFDCKRLSAMAPHLKDHIIAALTSPHPHDKIIAATSPWEGAAIANVYDVFVESHQRVHVDGMSFDMLRDFIAPSRITTPV